MNIPKVTHTPRVEPVSGQNEMWRIENVSVCDTGDGRFWCRFNDAHAGTLFRKDAPSFLACLAAALGCEVVEKAEEKAATPEERKAAGIESEAAGCERPPRETVAPEVAPRVMPDAPAASPRPEWVRILWRHAGEEKVITVGKVYRVVDWDVCQRPSIINDSGAQWILSSGGAAKDPTCDTFAMWEPASDPTIPAEPTEAQVEAAYDAFYATPEHMDMRGVLRTALRAALRAAARVK